MGKKLMIIDPSRCTGCRGCQVACKQWNEQPAVKTIFTGSYQNPPDLDGDTYTLVRFRERDNGKPFGVYWLLTNDKCRHCSEPTCVDGFSNAKDATFISPEGAVVYTDQAKAADFETVKEFCPFNIPRLKKSGVIAKCTLCYDRVAEGMEPACAHACPTDAISFGDYDAMMKYAEERIAWLKAKDGRVKADKIKLYPDLPSAVKWILMDDYDAHGLEGDV